MRRVVTTCVVLLLACSARAVWAQESFFSPQLLGVSEETAGGRARGLGTQGVGLGDVRTSLVLNPGALGGLQQMTFSAVGVAGTRNSTDGVLEYRSGLARFPHVRVALPVFGLAVVHAGFSGMRNFRSEFQLPRREIDALTYFQRFERDGTLYQIPVGVSGSLGSRLQVGITWDFVLGTVDEQWITEGDSIVALSARRRDTMDGQTATLGVLARPFGSLRIGASWSPGFDMDRARRVTLEDARANSAALPLRDSTEFSSFKYPQVVRAGAALDLGFSWMVTGDYMWRQWTAYTGDLYEVEPASLEEPVGNEVRFGGGIELSAQPRVHYRVGASRWTWPQSVGGERLHETAIHFGFGVDVKVDGGRFDFAVEHAWIGSQETNGSQERTWRFIVSLAGQEEWRRKSPRTR